MLRFAVMIMIPIALAGCGDKGLRDLRTNKPGPDEFLVNPVKPLAEPANYTTLPAPTPGQANLTDRSAIAEGVAAFGGRPESANAGIPASDGALVQHASRRGVNPNIRSTLAAEDAAFRKRKQRFTRIRLAPTDRYKQAYERQALDASREARRWRRAGARTPSSPPSN